MRHPRSRPVVEGLEAKALTAGLVVPPVGPVGLTLPVVDVTPVTRPAAGALVPVALTLTTDRSAYQVGQPVTITLKETNTTDRVVQISDGPSVDGFYVSQKGVTVWRSNAGFQPFFIREIDLAPGQSYTLRATWDGHPNSAFGGGELSASPTGAFVIHDQVAQYGVTAAPVAITVQTAPVPTPQPLVVSVRTDRASYQVGQPVTITLTETNTSRRDVPALFGARILNATVTGPKGPVWQFRDLRASATFLGVLHAGQSRTFTLTWDGAANLPGGAVVPGRYTVRAGVDGVSGAAVFTRG